MPKCKSKYKDLEKYRRWRNRGKRKNYAKGRIGCYKHEWTKLEDSLILYSLDKTDRQLALEIHHSVAAIQSRRYRLMKNLKEVNDESKFI